MRLPCDATGEADGLSPGGLALQVLDVGDGKRLAEVGMHYFSLLSTRGPARPLQSEHGI
jgi:hypothetical protein